jgi:hypothetical protein
MILLHLPQLSREDTKKCDSAFVSVVPNLEGARAESIAEGRWGSLRGRRQIAAHGVHQRLNSRIVVCASTQHRHTLLRKLKGSMYEKMRK